MTFSGFPCAANPQAGIFYPFTLFFLIFSVHYAFTLVFFIHLTGAGCGMFLFIRRKGIGIAASLFGACIFMMNYKVVGHIEAGHFNMICCYAYIPWLMIAVERLAKMPTLRSIVLFSGVGALSFLAGHPQLFYYSMIVCGSYFFYIILTENHKNRRKYLLSFLISIVISLLISMVLLLPMCELLLHSNRAGGAGFAGSSQSHIELIQFLPRLIVPDAIDTNWEKTIYFGFLPLLLIVLTPRKNLRGNRRFFLTLLIAASLFSCGQQGGLFSVFYYFVPGIKFFRAPARMFFFGEFAAATLAAFALDELPSFTAKRRRICLLSLAILFIFSAGYSIYTHKSALFLRYAIQCLTAGIGMGMMTRNRIRKSLSMAIIVLSTCIDLGAIAFHTLRVVPMNAVIPTHSLFKRLLYDNEIYRVWDLNNQFPQHVAIRFNTAKISGYQPITIPEYIDYIQGNDPLMPHFLNVKYIISKNPLSAPFLSEKNVIYHTDDSGNSIPTMFLYENTQCFPRCFLIPVPQDNHCSPDRAFEYFAEQNTVPVSAHIVKYTPNSVLVTCHTVAQSYLILSDCLFPGWKAEVNGKQHRILPVKTAFRALLLQEGQNRIGFYFRPDSLLIGGFITCGTLIFYMTVVVYLLRKRVKI